jgi:predicted GNAT family acetyltransferase
LAKVNTIVQTISYDDAASFLKDTQEELESTEAVNGLLLGICLRLAQYPERIDKPPTLKAVRDADGPILAAVMTPPFNIVLSEIRSDSRGNADAAVRMLAEKLVVEEIAVPGVLGPTAHAQSFARAWSDLTGEPAEISMRQRAFELREVKVPRARDGKLRPATSSDLELATIWCHAFMVDAFGSGDMQKAREIVDVRIADGAIYLWDVGDPVSMAMKTRPTQRGISISFVYTPPELRKRGYATACVAELSRMLLESGREFCSLFTDLSNPTSNHIYQEIGYRPVADFYQYSFR